MSDKLKEVFSSNLKRLMERDGVTQVEIVARLHTTSATVSDWVNGKIYPRMDKVQMLADYFKVSKADLIEEKSPAKHTAEEVYKIIVDVLGHDPSSAELVRIKRVLIPIFESLPDIGE
jgi:repressor LexA